LPVFPGDGGDADPVAAVPHGLAEPLRGEVLGGDRSRTLPLVPRAGEARTEAGCELRCAGGRYPVCEFHGGDRWAAAGLSGSDERFRY
jgi:hypothetical protein